MMSIEDSFNPYGLKVLVVDNDPGALFHLTEMLTSCQYQVRTCSSPAEALSLIRDENNKFDLVITEVHFAPDINGVEFLEIIVRETELPVVIVLADGKTDTITECIMKGACHCMPKPAKIHDIKVLWQHVARRVLCKLMKSIDKLEVNEPSSITSVEDKELSGSSHSDGVRMDDDQTKHQAKKRRMNWTDDSSQSDGGQMDDDQTKHEAKKRRMNWTDDLHQQFVDAVKHLGIKNAVPKKLVEIMNVPGLTRACVASHLQKYRSTLQKLSEKMQQRVTEQGSITQVPGDAYSKVFENKDSFISTQLTTGVQQVFTEQDSSSQVPIGANSQVMENNNLFIRNLPITDLEQYFTEQDSSTHVPIGTYHPVIEQDWEQGWFVGSPVVSPPITDAELNTLQPFELDNSLFQFHVPDYTFN